MRPRLPVALVLLGLAALGAAPAQTAPQSVPPPMPLPAPPSPPPSAPLAQPQTRAGFAQRADALVKPYLDAKLFSGPILVAHRGRPVFRRAYGLANREWGVPNTPETRFRVGSITKQFTAAAILKLAEAGRLNLDDPIRRFYPEAPAAWDRVTIRMVLTHGSGIPSYTNLPDYYARIQRLEMTPARDRRADFGQAALFEPGKGFDYDNTGYILLGLVVEATCRPALRPLPAGDDLRAARSQGHRL